MVTSSTSSPGNGDRQWFIVGRWQQYEGEARANLLRTVGIAVFYLVELVNYYGLRLGALEMPQAVDQAFHAKATALAAAWIVVALGIHLCLWERVFPAILKYLSTGLDLLFLTSMLVVADGPRSPLIVGYLLILVLSTLRFSLPLVRFATIGSVVGYLVVLGYARWFTERDLRVPRYSQIIFLVALALAGIVLGQVIRRVQAVAQQYAARLQANRGETP